MRDAIIELIKVKTIVTLVMTAVFAYLCCSGRIAPREFLTVFTVVTSFYFGTQHEKTKSE
ncbi:hypothetical protein IMSAG049_00422 [Clostridiales bacterium]|nr:hypothetical protein IMSAG049_00422 [Clostridiales bacterium]